MWQADLGNGKYRNPILYADYSDPDAIRVGEDYITSSGLFWPLFYTGAFYLVFCGILTILFGQIEKKLSYFNS